MQLVSSSSANPLGTQPWVSAFTTYSAHPRSQYVPLPSMDPSAESVGFNVSKE